MEFKRIDNLYDCKDVKDLYEKSFPPEEKVDFFSFFSGVFQRFKLYGLYKDNELIAMVHFNDTENFVHANYLAVDERYQNQGYGSAVLSWLKSRYNKTIVVDIEELEEDALNLNNRIRRKNFYIKNGFINGEYDFHWEGVFMTFMHCGEIDGEEFMSYIQIIFPTIKDITKKRA